MNLFKIKIYPNKWLMYMNYVLFCIMVFFKGYGDALHANNMNVGNIDNLKYMVLIIATFFSFGQLLKQGVLRNIFMKDALAFLALLLLWGGISLIIMGNARYPHTESTKYWIYIILPFLYAYGIINTSDEPVMNIYFKSMLVICFSCYLFLEKGIALFTNQNFAMISFANSASPFESAYAAGSSIAACAYFGYYRKGNTKWLILSMFFCFLTFKRASVVMMFLYFLLPYFFNKDQIVKRRWVLLQAMLFIVGTVFFAITLHPTNFFKFSNSLGIDLNSLLMGRGRLYGILVNSGYHTAGLGTTLDQIKYVIGKTSGIELELIQLLWEVTIAGLIGFVAYCYLLTRRNLYSLMIIGFMMVNMLTSSSLNSPFAWIFTYLTIWSITKRNAARRV